METKRQIMISCATYADNATPCVGRIFNYTCSSIAEEIEDMYKVKVTRIRKIGDDGGNDRCYFDTEPQLTVQNKKNLVK